MRIWHAAILYRGDGEIVDHLGTWTIKGCPRTNTVELRALIAQRYRVAPSTVSKALEQWRAGYDDGGLFKPEVVKRFKKSLKVPPSYTSS